MSDRTIVMFGDSADGQEAEYFEIIEDSDERLVVKATFGMVEAVVENLNIEDPGAPAVAALSDTSLGEAIGAAAGHVVRHADQS